MELYFCCLIFYKEDGAQYNACRAGVHHSADEMRGRMLRYLEKNGKKGSGFTLRVWSIHEILELGDE